MSFSFLLGILACCISAFVSVNKFGFALEGAWCAVDRIYYDSLYGQLKNSEPKWEGFQNVKDISGNLSKFNEFILKKEIDLKQMLYPSEVWELNTDIGFWKMKKVGDDEPEPVEGKELLLTRYTKIINSLIRLEKLNNVQNNELDDILNENTFKNIKSNFLEEFDYYARILRACLKVLAMIYYCLFLIVITAAGVSMMFYACLKRQGYLLTFMHVLWNVIRFFMFSFFLYGTAYGIGFLAIGDSIAYMMYVFNENLAEDKPKLIADGNEFFKFCLLNEETNLKYNNKIFDKLYINSINDFFTNYFEILKDSEDYGGIKSKLLALNESITGENANSDYKINVEDFNSLVERAGKEGGLFGSFDCGFLKSHLNLLYTALYDASVESRILSALSLTSSFFGAVAIYFFLLVMHHYNNELFFDTGKSIFTGFDGFGGGYKKKDKDKDPAYKKRKLRAEIELTSKIDEQSGYNDVRKNEVEED